MNEIREIYIHRWINTTTLWKENIIKSGYYDCIDAPGFLILHLGEYIFDKELHDKADLNEAILYLNKLGWNVLVPKDYFERKHLFIDDKYFQQR